MNAQGEHDMKSWRILPAWWLAMSLVACGGGGGGSQGGGGGDPSPTPPPAVAAPAITTPPQAQSVDDGAAASFTVTASGNGLSYQWQRDGTAVAGATAATLNLGTVALADNGARFRVVVSNAGGSVTSAEATLSVRAVAPTITAGPQATSVTAGGSATFTVTATGSAPLAYQWLRNGVEIAGATGASYTTTATTMADDGAQIGVRVSNAAGSVTSAAGRLTVQAAVVPAGITSQPRATSVGAGQTATFGVTATGTAPLSYQWQRNGVDIVGATTAGYTTPVLSVADDGARYTVRVSNASGSVISDAAVLTVTPVAPVSPLAGRAWTPVVQLAPDVFDGPLVGIADDGRAIVVSATLTRPATFPFTASTPFVVLGEPGGAGTPRWSTPVALSSFGTRSGAAVPADLRPEALRVAPNGRAVILATGTGGGCPESLPGLATECRFISMLDPVQRTWSPWDIVAKRDLSQRLDTSSLSMNPSNFALNDRGDVAFFASASSAFDTTARVFLRSATELAFRTVAFGPDGGTTGPQIGVLTMDEAGRLVLAASLDQNGTTDLAVWRGTIATGFQSPVVVDTRSAPATFRALWSGRNGRSFLTWQQNNGTADSLFGARFDAAGGAIVAEDLGPALLNTLPQRMLAAVGDDDTLIGYRFNGTRDLSTCATLRWPFSGAVQLVDAAGTCTLATSLFSAPSDDIASERGGNVLALTSGQMPWATYDAALNRQIAAPVDVGAVASGPGYALGVRRPASVRTHKLALSRSGVGVLVVTANLDVWPTPSSPSGDGRPTVANLWATYFK